MRHSFAGGSRQFKWYYLVAIALGLAAIVAVVYIIVRSGWLVERLNRVADDTDLIEDTPI